MTPMAEQIAREMIRDWTNPRTTLRRPSHFRSARALRGLADRLDPRS
jgi:hypothetical protein